MRVLLQNLRDYSVCPARAVILVVAIKLEPYRTQVDLHTLYTDSSVAPACLCKGEGSFREPKREELSPNQHTISGIQPHRHHQPRITFSPSLPTIARAVSYCQLCFFHTSPFICLAIYHYPQVVQDSGSLMTRGIGGSLQLLPRSALLASSSYQHLFHRSPCHSFEIL